MKHVIARKHGEQVRLWTRTTSDYSKAFTRSVTGSSRNLT